MADQKKPLFAAIPLQAIGHRGLSAADFQVLVAIAWHDQFGANGIGCYASLKTLARETGLAQTTISECTGVLEGFGLLKKRRHPLNRRTKVYSLIYGRNPRILPETGNCPSSHGAEGSKVPGSGNDRGATLRVGNSQVTETIEQTDTQYIPRSGRKKDKPPPGNTESPRRACAHEAHPRATGDRDSAFATEEKTRAREEQIGGSRDHRGAPRRARSRLEGTHAAGGDDSIVEREEKKEPERKLREALASRGGSPDFHGWAEWLVSEYGFDRRGAWEALMRWHDLADRDDERLNAELFNAMAEKPPDLEVFMTERLQASEL